MLSKFGANDAANETSIAKTDEEVKKCDGPHRGRFQAQGYAKNVDPPGGIELSKPWNRDCVAPLRTEGLTLISALEAETAVLNFKSAGYRGKAFSKMSKYIKKSPPTGFTPLDSIGWGIDPSTGKAVRNILAGAKAVRVDLEIKVGRAFGVK